MSDNVEFVDQRERELFARAELGEQARQFLAGNVGRYLHGRVKLELEEAQQRFADCDPDSWFGRRKMRKLQQKIEHCRMFMRFMVDCIQDAETAYSELKQYRGENT